MQNLFKIAKYLTIVHHIPGRIRIKISKQGILEFSKLPNSNFSLQATDFKGITNFRISKASLSCIINYDKKIIEPKDWQNLFDNILKNNYQKVLLILAKYKL